MTRVERSGYTMPPEEVNKKKHKEPLKNIDEIKNPSLETIDSGSISSSSKITSKPSVSFIGDDFSPLESLNTDNTGTLLQEMEKLINTSMKARNNLIPPGAAKSIYEKQAEIKTLLSKGKFSSPGDIKKINDNLLALVKQLNFLGLSSPEIKSLTDKMVMTLVSKFGKDFQIKLTPKIINGKLVGLDAIPNNGGKLTHEQKKVTRLTKDLLFDSESIKSAKSPLTADSVALMGMREALLRRSMDMPAMSNKPGLPPFEYKDMEFIANTLKMIDGLMASTKDIPDNLISDMQQSVLNMLSAQPGQVETVVNQSPKTATTQSILNFNKQLQGLDLKDPNNKALAGELLGYIESQIKSLGMNTSSGMQKNLSIIEQIGNELNNLNSSGGSLQSLVSSLNQSIKSFTSQVQGLTKSVNDVAAPFLDLVKNAPHDISSQVSDIISSYSSAMNGIQSSLPPFLPFPVTMPVPLAYNDGSGNSFIIPAGSTLSQKSGAYTIESNGMVMQSGDTLINSGQSTIKLGKDVDSLSFDTLSVDTKDSDLLMTGFDATIDRKNGTSAITAEHATIDMTNGQIDLTNASLTQDSNGNVQILSDSFLYEKDGDSTSFTGFKLNQTKTDTTSTLSGSANNLVSNNAGSTITADSMSFNMVKDTSNGTDTAQIKGTNINYQGNDGSSLNAASATVDIINNADNSSLITFNALSPSYTSKDSSLSAVGPTDLSISRDSDGNVTNLNVFAKDLTYTDTKNGSSLNATKGTLNVDYNPDGSVSAISAGADTLNYSDKSGNINANGGKVDLNYDSKGNIQNITANTNTLNYTSSKGEVIDVTKGNVNVNYGENGKLSSITGSANKIDYTGKNGDIVNATGTNVALNYNDNGTLQNASATVGSVNYQSSKGDKVDVKNGSMNINYGDNGKLSSVTGSAGKIDYTGKSGDIVSATGTNVELNYNDNGTLQNASATVGSVNYQSSKGDKVDLTNGSVNLTYDSNGQLSNATGSIEKLDYTSQKGDTVTASGTNVALNYNENGNLQNASATVGSINYQSSKGEKVDVTNGAVNLTYDDSGKLTNATGSADTVNWTGTTGQTLTANGINISLDSSQLTASFNDLNYVQTDDKAGKTLTVNATNGEITDTKEQTTVHVDSAEVIQEVAKHLDQNYNVTVENVDLVVSKNDKGGVAGMDLQIEGLDAKIDGMNITVKTQNGDRLRLNVAMSEDGTYITTAFLQIPTGGEIKVDAKDYDLTFGGDQKISFSQDGKGTYTLRDDNIDVKYETKNTKVTVEGGSAQVSFDTANGNIIIDEITGTNIVADIKGKKVNIDIKKVEDMILQAGSFDDGTTKAYAIFLKPNSDNSTLSAEIKADVKGIPVSIKFDDVHSLEASGMITTNMAHVYVGDRSGKGNVEADLGPLKSHGSAIEFLAQYHTYDAQRMMSSISSLMSRDGVNLGKGFSFEPDGVIRLSSQNRGPHAEVAVLLPHTVNNPYQPSTPGMKDDSFGLVTSLGWKFGKQSETQVTTDAFAGLVPGSFVSVDQLQGSTTIYGIPLPRHIAVPTTAVGGISVNVDGQSNKVNVMAGGYFNPVSLVPQDGKIPLSENTKYGGFAGFNVTQSDTTFSALGTVGVKQDNTLDPGFRLGLSTKFNMPQSSKEEGNRQ